MNTTIRTRDEQLIKLIAFRQAVETRGLGQGQAALTPPRIKRAAPRKRAARRQVGQPASVVSRKSAINRSNGGAQAPKKQELTDAGNETQVLMDMLTRMKSSVHVPIV